MRISDWSSDVCSSDLRFVPRGPDLFRIVAEYAFKTDQLGELMIGDIGDLLRGDEARIAFHQPLLPCHLIKILIVENHHDEARIGPLVPGFRKSDQLGLVVHLPGTVAHNTVARTTRMGELADNRSSRTHAHKHKHARKT